MYRPSIPFTSPFVLLEPTLHNVNGAVKKEYTETISFLAGVKSYGGTEKVENGVLVVADTITVETWYRPEIQANCRIRNQITGKEYDLLPIDNIEERNQFIRFKAQATRGGA